MFINFGSRQNSPAVRRKIAVRCEGDSSVKVKNARKNISKLFPQTPMLIYSRGEANNHLSFHNELFILEKITFTCREGNWINLPTTVRGGVCARVDSPDKDTIDWESMTFSRKLQT